MSDLITALQIFLKYADPRCPTHCEHDVLMVCEIAQNTITDPEDLAALERLGFHWSTEYDCWASYRFGSA